LPKRRDEQIGDAIDPRTLHRGRLLAAAVATAAILFGLAVGVAHATDASGGTSPPAGCQTTPASASDGELDNGPAALEQLIEDVPCPATTRVQYDTTDNLGEAMGLLDPIRDPAGGYLGVYHSPFGSPAGATPRYFRISLAHSTDLMHWTRIRILDPVGASMPTLRRIPGNPGFILAYEKNLPPGWTDVVRIRYYPTLAALLSNQVAAQRDLPRRYSIYNNGTPSIVSIAWHGSLSRSVIRLDFHYETEVHRRPGPDREASGTLRGFSRWRTSKNALVDELLDREGLIGSHGNERAFAVAGRSWHLYEAQTSFEDFGSWHILLYDPRSKLMFPLTIATAAGAFATSFGEPIAEVLPSPTGGRQVLVISTFVFGSGEASRENGELVHYQPI
jgi:hypothetical protein